MSEAAAPSAETIISMQQQRKPAGTGADDGLDAFINCLGRWSVPVVLAKGDALAAQI